MDYPAMHAVEQALVSRPLRDIPAAIHAELGRWNGWGALQPGASIAVTAGSRGIANIALIVRTVCGELTARGYRPFVVLAMGSHGGATPEGQLDVLRGLGITEVAVGAPIRAGREVYEVGCSSRGQPVLMDRLAHRADGLIVLNRIKKHTDFRGPVESGLMKIITIGLGKERQAGYVHSFGAEGLRTLIPEFAQIALANSPVLFGLAILEDGYDETSDIVLLPRERIATEEPKLLRRAIRQMPRLPLRAIDVLIVERMGKNISGTGMDTNVIGRYKAPGVPDPAYPRARFLVVLDLTEESHGNAIGVGLADLTTARLAAKIEPTAFYMNNVTSGFLERGKIPLVCPSDQEAVNVALHLLGSVTPAQARVVRIADTLHLSRFWASAACAAELAAMPGVTVSPEAHALCFSDQGTLK